MTVLTTMAPSLDDQGLSTCLAAKFSRERRLLVPVAAYPEVVAVLKGLDCPAQVQRDLWRAYRFPCLTVLQTGVGKANAAGAVAAELTRARINGSDYAGVISLGVSGSYQDLPSGTTVCCSQAVLADEGMELEGSFESLKSMGWAKTVFPLDMEVDWIECLSLQADIAGGVNTISAISGTVAMAQRYQLRTQAIAEDMETASLALVSQQFGVPFGALRVICNECGSSKPWDLNIGLDRLSELVRQWKFDTSSWLCQSTPVSVCPADGSATTIPPGRK